VAIAVPAGLGGAFRTTARADERKLHARICLHLMRVANVGGAREFSLMSFLSGARRRPTGRGQRVSCLA
jgi:hypothetical protein